MVIRAVTSSSTCLLIVASVSSSSVVEWLTPNCRLEFVDLRQLDFAEVVHAQLRVCANSLVATELAILSDEIVPLLAHELVAESKDGSGDGQHVVAEALRQCVAEAIRAGSSVFGWHRAPAACRRPAAAFRPMRSSMKEAS